MCYSGASAKDRGELLHARDDSSSHGASSHPGACGVHGAAAPVKPATALRWRGLLGGAIALQVHDTFALVARWQSLSEEGADIGAFLNEDWALDVNGHITTDILFLTINIDIDGVGHVAVVAVSLIAVSCVLNAVIIVDVTRSHSCVRTVNVEEGDTIRPDVVLFEVAGNVHLCQGHLNVLSQVVLDISVAMSELVTEVIHGVLKRLKVMIGLVAVNLEALIVVEFINGLMEDLHDVVRIMDGVILQILNTPVHVIDSRVDHLGHRRDKSFVVNVVIHCEIKYYNRYIRRTIYTFLYFQLPLGLVSWGHISFGGHAPLEAELPHPHFQFYY